MKIEFLKKSPIISIGKRREFMNSRKPDKKDTEIKVNALKYKGQEKMVPKKVVRIILKWEEIKDIPIDVLQDEKGDFHIMDGHHRALAAIILKKKTIKANIYKYQEKEAGFKEILLSTLLGLSPVAAKSDDYVKYMLQGLRKTYAPETKQIGRKVLKKVKGPQATTLSRPTAAGGKSLGGKSKEFKIKLDKLRKLRLAYGDTSANIGKGGLGLTYKINPNAFLDTSLKGGDAKAMLGFKWRF